LAWGMRSAWWAGGRGKGGRGRGRPGTAQRGPTQRRSALLLHAPACKHAHANTHPASQHAVSACRAPAADNAPHPASHSFTPHPASSHLLTGRMHASTDHHCAPTTTVTTVDRAVHLSTSAGGTPHLPAGAPHRPPTPVLPTPPGAHDRHRPQPKHAHTAPRHLLTRHTCTSTPPSHLCPTSSHLRTHTRRTRVGRSP
jgi:hypothetical protein